MPESWSSPQLEELALFVLGGDWGKAPDYDDEDFVDVACIRGAEFRNWNANNGSTAAHRKIKKNSLLSRQLIEDDILVEISGGGPEQPVGRTVLITKTVLAHNSELPKVCTNFLRLYRPSTLLRSKYLNFFLLYFYTSGEVVKYQAGSNNLRNLKFNDYLKIEVPFSPINEQHRIVAKIEELFSEIDKGVESLKTAKAQLQVYRQALLKHAFEGKLTAQWRADNPDKVVPAAQVLAQIKQAREERYQQQLDEWKTAVEKWEFGGKEGKKPSKPKVRKPSPESKLDTESLNFVPSVTAVVLKITQYLKEKPSNGKSVKDRSEGFKVLRLTCLKQEKIDLDECKEGDWDYEEAEKYLVRKDDFLISRGNGSLNLVGKGGLVVDDRQVAYPDTIVRLPIEEKIFRPRLFSIFWNSAIFRQQIERTARTTAGIYKINQQLISEYLMPCFSLPEQDEMLLILEAELTNVDALSSGIKNDLVRAKALRQSILKKAFSGQLVPQDPNDEPASQLLARIQDEKRRQPQSKATKKTRKGKAAL